MGITDLQFKEVKIINPRITDPTLYDAQILDLLTGENLTAKHGSNQKVKEIYYLKGEFIYSKGEQMQDSEMAYKNELAAQQKLEQAESLKFITKSKADLLKKIALKEEEHRIFVDTVNQIWQHLEAGYDGKNTVSCRVKELHNEEATSKLMDKIQNHYEDLGFTVKQICFESMPPQYVMEFS